MCAYEEKKYSSCFIWINLRFISCLWAELIKAKEVSFSNGMSGLKANNVQDAIEEIYNKTVDNSLCKMQMIQVK